MCRACGLWEYDSLRAHLASAAAQVNVCSLAYWPTSQVFPQGQIRESSSLSVPLPHSNPDPVACLGTVLCAVFFLFFGKLVNTFGSVQDSDELIRQVSKVSSPRHAAQTPRPTTPVLAAAWCLTMCCGDSSSTLLFGPHTSLSGAPP